MTAKLLHFRGGCHLRVKGKGTEDRGRCSPRWPLGSGGLCPGHSCASDTQNLPHGQVSFTLAVGHPQGDTPKVTLWEAAE